MKKPFLFPIRNGFTFLYHIIQVSHVVQVRAVQKLQKQHALKGQKLLAQGGH